MRVSSLRVAYVGSARAECRAADPNTVSALSACAGSSLTTRDANLACLRRLGLQSLAQRGGEAQRLAAGRDQHDHHLGGKEIAAVAAMRWSRVRVAARPLLGARRHLQHLVDARGLAGTRAPCAAPRRRRARAPPRRRSAPGGRCRAGAGSRSGRARTSAGRWRDRRGRRNPCPRSRRGSGSTWRRPPASSIEAAGEIGPAGRSARRWIRRRHRP